MAAFGDANKSDPVACRPVISSVVINPPTSSSNVGFGSASIWRCQSNFNFSPDNAIVKKNTTSKGGALVLVGLPVGPVRLDIPTAISKEVRIETVFRYANVFDRAIDLIASGKVDLKPLLTNTFAFKDSIRAFEQATSGLPSIVKVQITLPDEQH
jgi:hypothetical protein